MRVCVITPGRDVYSETFIRAHIERIPGVVSVLSDGSFPSVDQEGKPLLAHPGLITRCGRAFYRRVRRLPYDFFQKQALQNYLKRNRIDVVLAEYGFTGAAVMDVCRAARVPLCVHFHGFDAYRHDVAGPEAYEQIFDQAAVLIAVSNAMRHQLINLGASANQILVNPCGVDVRNFPSTDAGKNPPRFVAVGRFVDKKAPYLTLMAFEQVLKHVPAARLSMLGDGPLLEVCSRMAHALGMDEAVSFPGVSDPGDVARTMQGARAFVQHSLIPKHGPSAGDSEGTPVAVLEAMASGLPVVATRHAGIAEAVVDHETGYLIAEGDVRSMAECMITLAAHPEMASRMGAAARQRAETHYSMDMSIDRLSRILCAAATHENPVSRL